MEIKKTNDKYLSVLTNFGCHYECPYCIVKNTGIMVPKTTVEGLQGLEKAIVENDVNWVSISGGGDPFYKFEENIDWWNELLEIIGDLDREVKLELHTSYLPDTYEEMDGYSIYWPFDRVVYHCRNISDLFRIKRYSNQIVRVVYVVTEAATEEKIDAIAAIAKYHPQIDELSFRQMVDKDYQATHYCEEYLKAGHGDKWYYIEQCDYNLYYAENEVKTRYEDYRRKV